MALNKWHVRFISEGTLFEHLVIFKAFYEISLYFPYFSVEGLQFLAWKDLHGKCHVLSNQGGILNQNILDLFLDTQVYRTSPCHRTQVSIVTPLALFHIFDYCKYWTEQSKIYNNNIYCNAGSAAGGSFPSYPKWTRTLWRDILQIPSLACSCKYCLVPQAPTSVK